jgi:hypothetical protein
MERLPTLKVCSTTAASATEAINKARANSRSDDKRLAMSGFNCVAGNVQLMIQNSRFDCFEKDRRSKNVII